FQQKAAYEIETLLEFRRVLFRSVICRSQGKKTSCHNDLFDGHTRSAYEKTIAKQSALLCENSLAIPRTPIAHPKVCLVWQLGKEIGRASCREGVEKRVMGGV